MVITSLENGQIIVIIVCTVSDNGIALFELRHHQSQCRLYNEVRYDCLLYSVVVDKVRYISDDQITSFIISQNTTAQVLALTYLCYEAN